MVCLVVSSCRGLGYRCGAPVKPVLSCSSHGSPRSHGIRVQSSKRELATWQGEGDLSSMNAAPRGHKDSWADAIKAHISIAAVAICLASCSGPAQAGTILRGNPRVVDGDTLELENTKVRFFGVDAPESKQLCKTSAGKDYKCGDTSTEALKAKIGTSKVECDVMSTDMYGRSVSVCSLPGALNAKGEELNKWMVDNGQAVAYREYSKNYVSSEDAAKAQKKGIWQGQFQYPADWRKDGKGDTPAAQPEMVGGKPDLAAGKPITGTAPASAPAPGTAPGAAQGSAPPPGCNIKGNISKSGKIYHVPGGAFYDRTVIDTSDGERWFCSAAQAESAGWRASKQ